MFILLLQLLVRLCSHRLVSYPIASKNDDKNEIILWYTFFFSLSFNGCKYPTVSLLAFLSFVIDTAVYTDMIFIEREREREKWPRLSVCLVGAAAKT